MIPGLPERQARLMVFGGLAMAASWVFFLLDVTTDLTFSQGLAGHSGSEGLIHHAFEALAVVGLTFGLAFLVLYARRWQDLNENQAAQIRRYRSSFGDVLEASFEAWQLTQAERDVALMVLRGLSNSTIADLRATSVSTVKGQLHSIFRKAGVETRNQLMNHFMEEFLAGEGPSEDGTAVRPVAA